MIGWDRVLIEATAGGPALLLALAAGIKVEKEKGAHRVTGRGEVIILELNREQPYSGS